MTAGPAPGLLISCDFDGTVTLTDTVNALLEAYALPEWRIIEDEWCAGKFGSSECLARQTELLRIRPDVLSTYLDAVEIDSGLRDFAAACTRANLPLVVVSDGYDLAVRRVLGRAGLDLPIVANRLVHMGEDRWRVLFPHSSAGCGYGVCKCRAARRARLRVHIGDGRSDFCAAEHADLVFAKGALLERLERQGGAVIPFERFSQLHQHLPHLAERAEEGARARACRQTAR